MLKTREEFYMSVNLMFALYLYQTREEHNLTQEKMSEIMDVSVRWYQSIEKGSKTPNFRVICLLVKSFDLDLRYLLKEVSYNELLQAAQ